MDKVMRVQRGANVEVDIAVTDDDGVALDISEATLSFQARATLEDETALIAKETDAGITHGGTTGSAVLAFVPADTADVPSQLRFGLWVTDVMGRRFPLVERGFLFVDESAVRFEVPGS